MKNIEKTDELFDLIKSLSKTEKIHFKKYAKQHIVDGNANYLVLFDLIEKTRNYKSAKLHTQLKKLPFYPFLPKVKNYLKELILHSLRSYYTNKSVELWLHDSFMKIEILWSKGLYSQCGKLVKKTKQYAKNYDNLLGLIQVLVWEVRLSQFLPPSSKHSNFYAQKKDELHPFLQAFGERMELHLHSRLVYNEVNKSGSGITTNQRTELKKLFTHPLIEKSNSYFKYPHDKINQLLLKQVIAEINGEIQQSIEISENCLSLYNKYPNIKEAGYSNYLDALGGLISKQLKLFNPERSNALLLQMKLSLNSPGKFISEKALNEYRIYYHVMNLLFIIRIGCDTEAGESAIHEINQLLQVDRDLSFKHRILLVADIVCSIFYIAEKNYKIAIKHLNKITTNHTYTESIFYNLGLMLQLIVHLEMGSYEYITYFVHHIKRQNKKNPGLDKSFEVILTGIENIAKLGPVNSKELKKLYGTIFNQLIELDGNSSQNFITLRYPFDFIAWLDSKRSHVSFKESLENYAHVIQQKS